MTALNDIIIIPFTFLKGKFPFSMPIRRFKYLIRDLFTTSMFRSRIFFFLFFCHYICRLEKVFPSLGAREREGESEKRQF